MNKLIVGSDKSPIPADLPDTFLLIDDGEISDGLSIRAKHFNPEKHAFNPLKDMDDRKADAFLSVLDAVFPEGANTLTRRYSNHFLFKHLIAKPKRLDKLALPSKDPYERDAYEKIERFLLSPVLEPVLNTTLSFTFSRKNIARLNRAEIGDFNCFVLANFLILQYPGTVIIPDFGFYACDFHASLIRQNRLIAGINSFDEVPKFRSQLLLIETKIASQCTPEDAETLAQYSGKAPGTNTYNDFIAASIAPQKDNSA